MYYIQNFGLYIILIETVLLFGAAFVIYIQYSNYKDDRKLKSKYETIKAVYNNLKKQFDSKQNECASLRNQYNKIHEQLGDSVIEISQLKTKIEQLTKKASIQSSTESQESVSSECEVKRFTLGKEPSELNNNDVETTQEDNKTEIKLNAAQEEVKAQNQVLLQEQKETKQDVSKGTIMYASFPRSAGDKIYFSDLTEKKADDSFFEISVSGNKASFKPLDFLKIRNYDDAMIAMTTEGVKPQAASSVIGIEPGSVYLEGKDWFIDKQAKIKLA